jgi:hypothetical protein
MDADGLRTAFIKQQLVSQLPRLCHTDTFHRDSLHSGSRRYIRYAFPLTSGERLFEPEWLAPHPVLIESVSGEFIPSIYKGCKRYLFLSPPSRE